jgi:GTP-binding protein Era
LSQEPDKRRCGFVALVGAPNAGKSTLLNSLVGTKVSIVTPKVQTTRARLRAIAIAGESQIVFVDTPGIFAPQRRLERAMVAAAWSGAEDADLVVLVVDVTSRRRDPDTERIIEGLKRQGAGPCWRSTRSTGSSASGSWNWPPATRPRASSTGSS